MISVVLMLGLVADPGTGALTIGSDQNPQDFQLPIPPKETASSASQSQSSVGSLPVQQADSGGLKKEHELKQADIEGNMVAPQGFQDFKDVVPRSRRLLEERLQFKLWEATRLGF